MSEAGGAQGPEGTQPDTVARLIGEFAAEHRAGGEVDPGSYLEQVEEPERTELEALIDAYLDRAPGRPWDRGAFAASRSAELVERFERSVAAEPGSSEQGEGWPQLLPRLRIRAKLRRDALVDALAKALDVPLAKREKVAGYYHRMERGELPAEGVSERVLEALAALLGESAELLRRAGRVRPGPEAAAAGTFARIGEPDPRYVIASAEDAEDEADLGAEDAAEPVDEIAEPAASPGAAPDEDWDEVDELFLGGRPS